MTYKHWVEIDKYLIKTLKIKSIYLYLIMMIRNKMKNIYKII